MQGFPVPGVCHHELHQAFSTGMVLSQNKSFLPQVSSAGDFATVMCKARDTPTVYTLRTGSVPCGVSQGALSCHCGYTACSYQTSVLLIVNTYQHKTSPCHSVDTEPIQPHCGAPGSANLSWAGQVNCALSDRVPKQARYLAGSNKSRSFPIGHCPDPQHGRRPESGQKVL